MLTELQIRSVASYPETKPVCIDTTAYLNLFYGDNGVGKTTISRLIRNPNAPEHSKCEIKSDPPKSRDAFVYNHDFVNEQFYESDQLPGIFTLGEKNVEAEHAIDQANHDWNTAQENLEQVHADMERVRCAKVDRRKAAIDRTWDIKLQFENTPLEEPCLKGLMGSRERLFERLCISEDSDDPVDLTALQNMAEELESESADFKTRLNTISHDVREIEHSDLFGACIVGSDESYLSDRIASLGNSDWVRTGWEYLQTDPNHCPFCQQPTPPDFERNLREFFDESYKRQCEKIGQYLRDYEGYLTKLERTFESGSYQDDYVHSNPEFARAKSAFMDVLKGNLERIREKVAQPSIPVAIETSDNQLSALNDVIQSIDEEIARFNERVTNRTSYRDEIAQQFWRGQKRIYKSIIDDLHEHAGECDRELEILQSREQGLEQEIEMARRSISDNQKKLTNPQTAIDNINRRINGMGLRGFQVVRANGDEALYRIARADGQHDAYRSLSEGEKTLVAFLYFLEWCRGASEPDAPVRHEDRIIVIDDPVSSLSHNYVYDIATLIVHTFIRDQPMRQVFVLTHSLFFFNEIKIQQRRTINRDDRCRLFRVYKDPVSKVRRMAPDEIRNDYEALWQTVRQVRDGDANATLLPNVMRNILEQFFGFVRSSKHKDALEALSFEETEIKSFIRYLDRESHSDADNITDFGDTDPTRFLRVFRDVFDRAGYNEHFERMMGESYETH